MNRKKGRPWLVWPVVCIAFVVVYHLLTHPDKLRWFVNGAVMTIRHIIGW